MPPIDRQPRTATPAEPADAALVARARNKEQGATAILRRRYTPVVRAVLLARAPLPDVDRLVPDVFATAWDSLGTLRSDASFGEWLCAVARNASAIAHHRRSRFRGRLRALIFRICFNDARKSSFETVDAVRALPDSMRESMMLRLVETMSGPDIARCTGMVPGTVRMNLHRGMQILVERPDDTPGDRCVSYLWDPEATPDDEIAAIESRLVPVRHDSVPAVRVRAALIIGVVLVAIGGVAWWLLR